MRRENVAVWVRSRTLPHFAPIIEWIEARIGAPPASPLLARHDAPLVPLELDARKALTFDWYLQVEVLRALPFVIAAVSFATLMFVNPNNPNLWFGVVLAFLLTAGSFYFLVRAAGRLRAIRRIVRAGVAVASRVVEVDREQDRRGFVTYAFVFEYGHEGRRYTVRTPSVKAPPELVGQTPTVLLDVATPALGLIQDLYV